ncbi:MAG: Uma2 family endonuclease [Terriglobia bacterium]|jgi:Uma2 family endonuclease
MATKTTITWDQFVAAGVEGQKCEWVDGEIVQMSPVNFRHEAILFRLIAFIDGYCRRHLEWIGFASNAAYTMASGNWRCPDASLVRADRFAGGQYPVMADFAPDVAFEIHSPSDKPSEIQSKRKDYQQSGVIQVWIDPDKRLVELIYPDRPLEYFQEGDPLIIASLPDFSLDLKDLFAI